MTNHPNRGRRGPGSSPTPAEVRAAREAAGLTQTEAARLVHGTLRGWQGWEASPTDPGARRMHPGLWELFCGKVAARQVDAAADHNAGSAQAAGALTSRLPE